MHIRAGAVEGMGCRTHGRNRVLGLHGPGQQNAAGRRIHPARCIHHPRKKKLRKPSADGTGNRGNFLPERKESHVLSVGIHEGLRIDFIKNSIVQPSRLISSHVDASEKHIFYILQQSAKYINDFTVIHNINLII